MYVLLRNEETGMFYAGPERWAEHTSDAVDFVTIPDATQFALAHLPPGMEIVIPYGSSAGDIILPVVADTEEESEAGEAGESVNR